NGGPSADERAQGSRRRGGRPDERVLEKPRRPWNEHPVKGGIRDLDGADERRRVGVVRLGGDRCAKERGADNRQHDIQDRFHRCPPVTRERDGPRPARRKTVPPSRAAPKGPHIYAAESGG